MYTYLYCKELLKSEHVRVKLALTGYEPQRLLMQLCGDQNRKFDCNPAVTHKGISQMVMSLICWAESVRCGVWLELHGELEQLGL